MDPWAEDDFRPATKNGVKKPRKRITLPKPPKPPPRDALARTLGTMRELAEFVGEIRTALAIPQARLAARAGVSRQWLVALGSGRPTVEAGKVLRTLEALGFELVVTPYDPPPPWMLRAVAEAELKRALTAKAARARRNATAGGGSARGCRGWPGTRGGNRWTWIEGARPVSSGDGQANSARLGLIPDLDQAADPPFEQAASAMDKAPCVAQGFCEKTRWRWQRESSGRSKRTLPPYVSSTGSAPEPTSDPITRLSPRS